MLVRAALFPLFAIVFALSVIGADFGMRPVPHAAGWAPIIGLVAAGGAALTLLRVTPELGAALGSLDIAAASYLAGLVVTAVLYWVFGEHDRARR